VALGDRTFVPRQGNNCYIFPGVGLGVLAVGARRVTDEMFMAAARALAAFVTQADLDRGAIFPPLTMMREVSVHVAAAVAEVAYRQGHATAPRPADLPAHVASCMWQPDYPVYVKEQA
jgi:malate dehydrogenase (oxaloacetate-decarboxylating)(NADP+)